MIGNRERPQPDAPSLTPSVFRELCAELSRLQYRGVPIGETINESLVINLFWGHSDQRLSTRGLTQARRVRHRLHPRLGDRVAAAHARDRILMTWYTSTPRLDELLLPVLREIGSEHALVLLGQSGATPTLPPGVPAFYWERAMGLRTDDWRRQYRSCRPEWHRSLKDVCRRYHLPPGTFALLSLALTVASQRIEGFLGFLTENRPAAILTEYDRNKLWSCLVLAAGILQIPTVTLVHGVMGAEAIGFAPVLADRIVCWGEADKRKLLAAGEPPERIVVGGCPRLTRDLSCSRQEARTRLGIEPNARVALLATSPDRGHLTLAEQFCASVESTPGVLGMVRLHPAESRLTYAKVAERHPLVRFMENTGSTLDESLAAADVVVVRGSGVGSDALVKRRAVIVLDPEGELAGNDRDLVQRAGCPHARGPEELSGLLRRLLEDGDYRAARSEAAEGYVSDFCHAFGGESARLIGDLVKEMAGKAGSQA